MYGRSLNKIDVEIGSIANPILRFSNVSQFSFPSGTKYFPKFILNPRFNVRRFFEPENCSLGLEPTKRMHTICRCLASRILTAWVCSNFLPFQVEQTFSKVYIKYAFQRCSNASKIVPISEPREPTKRIHIHLYLRYL